MLISPGPVKGLSVSNISTVAARAVKGGVLRDPCGPSCRDPVDVFACWRPVLLHSFAEYVREYFGGMGRFVRYDSLSCLASSFQIHYHRGLKDDVDYGGRTPWCPVFLRRMITFADANNRCYDGLTQKVAALPRILKE